jgi:hypothetical protein
MSILGNIHGSIFSNPPNQSVTMSTNTHQLQGPLLVHPPQTPYYPGGSSSVIFNGNITVVRVANGYIVNVSRNTRDSIECYVAKDIQEVNERITACMVVMRLEDDPGPA